MPAFTEVIDSPYTKSLITLTQFTKLLEITAHACVLAYVTIAKVTLTLSVHWIPDYVLSLF
jgi:hypothetical protein